MLEEYRHHTFRKIGGINPIIQIVLHFLDRCLHWFDFMLPMLGIDLNLAKILPECAVQLRNDTETGEELMRRGWRSVIKFVCFQKKLLLNGRWLELPPGASGVEYLSEPTICATCQGAVVIWCRPQTPHESLKVRHHGTPVRIAFVDIGFLILPNLTATDDLTTHVRVHV